MSTTCIDLFHYRASISNGIEGGEPISEHTDVGINEILFFHCFSMMCIEVWGSFDNERK